MTRGWERTDIGAGLRLPLRTLQFQRVDHQVAGLRGMSQGPPWTTGDRLPLRLAGVSVSRATQTTKFLQLLEPRLSWDVLAGQALYVQVGGPSGRGRGYS